MVCLMAKDPLATLYNYPDKIQERVKSMDEYKDKIPTMKNKIFTKVLVSIFIIIIMSLILKYINNCNTFKAGFFYSFIIWFFVNVYDVLILDIVWFCHSKRFVFKGTEDMIDEYRNYWFHIKEGLIGELIGLFISLLVGIIVMI